MLSETKIMFINKLIINAEKYKNKPAIIFLNNLDVKESISYGKLYQEVQRLAQYIRSKTKKNNKAIICLPPGINFIIAFYACLFCDIVAIPVMVPYNKASADRLNLINKNSNSDFILTDSYVNKQLRKLDIINYLKKSTLTAGLHQYLNFLHNNVEVEKGSAEWLEIDKIPQGSVTQEIFPESSDDNIAFLQYTSGSTSSPKGVCISFGNLDHNLEMIGNFVTNDPSHIAVSWLPPFHDMGLIGTLLFPLFIGGTTVQLSPVQFLKHPLTWLEAIHQYRATITTAPNFAYDLVTRKITEEILQSLDLTSMRIFGNGAEPIRFKTMKQFVEKFSSCGVDWGKIAPLYGLAEATLLVTGRPTNTIVKKLTISLDAYAKRIVEVIDENSDQPKLELTSVGAPHGATDLLIVDTQKFSVMSEDHVGEICINNSSVSKGYWDNEEATKAAFIEIDGRNYLHSGDLGFMHDGELFITGRIKDLIIINGKNFYPQDIEEIVESVGNHIRPGCSAAFATEGSLTDEVVIVAELREKLSNYDELTELVRKAIWMQFNIVLKEIVFIQARTILKTTSGKIRRQKIKESYLNNELAIC